MFEDIKKRKMRKIQVELEPQEWGLICGIAKEMEAARVHVLRAAVKDFLDKWWTLQDDEQRVKILEAMTGVSQKWLQEYINKK
jgi:hypothetical protein